MAWLDSLRADAAFGWRQILKHKAASAAAILSLGLSMGASMAAFRLIDALFLRPLPVAHPERLYALTFENLFEGKIFVNEYFSYPAFRRLRDATKDEAALLAISFPERIDLTFGGDRETERAVRQYVSGRTFGEFGLKPALGRLLNESDDIAPGTHPYAMISYDYWTRRFGKDSSVLGRRFRNGREVLQIIGVTPEGFTGTDPGVFADIFLPSAMDASAVSDASTVYRIWLYPKSGGSLGELRERIHSALRSYREEEVKSWSAARAKEEKDFFVAARVTVASVATGRSYAQNSYQRAMAIFAVLVGLVLLIACANVANLMTAQAALRAREMALRVAIGAGRARLLQLVLIEGALIGVAASVAGLAFSAWAMPFLVGELNFANQALQLALPADWRVTAFALALTFAVTLLFALAPALHASSLTPVSALKGGGAPHFRRRLRNGLIVVQVAFCTLVLFTAGEFISTFQRMANQPTGFSSERLLTIESASDAGQPAQLWYQAMQRLRSLPGIESAALADYALMSFHAKTRFIWANGHVPDGTWSNSTWFLGVSPGWFETMRLGLLQGRDFRSADAYPSVAIVNETFARRYFAGESPVGRTFEAQRGINNTGGSKGNVRLTLQIIGVARDARYEDMRLPIPPTAYVPFQSVEDGAEESRREATFLVRTSAANPLSLAAMLRREIEGVGPDFRVVNIVPQEELIGLQMSRERLLATLALFFGAVALILAGVGLYSVLNHSVLERRRELGIRMALGATGWDIAHRVTVESGGMVAAGAAIGLGLGLGSERYVEELLYQVRATDPHQMALPFITLLAAAVLAALPPVLRAVRLNPARLLRSE
jgi:predicted permease